MKCVTYKQKGNSTCGDEDCRTMACVGKRTYQNGSRKPVWYFNKFENKEVLLDSSWEVTVADYLNEKDIEWIRPDFIKWVDSEGTIRRYFPDFYLPQFDLYLDPKNKYCMTKDVEKMNFVENIVKLQYGELKYIINIIDSLKD